MIPYTDKAKKALNYANRLSRSSGCNYVGTEHILAGLLKEGTGVAVVRTSPRCIIRSRK